MLDLKTKLKIEDIADEQSNLATKIDDDDLARIANDVISKFELDRESRATWEDMTEKALDLAELKHESKHTPWANASNVKYPLVATSVMQFAARQYPEIVRNGKVVKAATFGLDEAGLKEDRATRISNHMSYQLLYEMEEWEDDLDKLLNMLGTVGVAFKKTYFDPVKDRNVSELCSYDAIYIHDDVRSLEEARRITHRIPMHKNTILENARLGIFEEMEESELDTESIMSEQLDAVHEILEQHRYLDLDGDGYEEPYIVTVDNDLRKVLRIIPRFTGEDVELTEDDKILKINPVEYFTDFHFIRSPRGSFYSLGFGQLLFSLNHSVNTILNQLIDAGSLSTMQGGFISKGLRLKGGQQSFRPGEYKTVQTSSLTSIRDQIYQFEHKEPSSVLFQLLGLLIEATKEVSSVNDALTGTEQAQNVPATTMLALIEQGTKVFSSIQRRLYRSLRREYNKLYRLNQLHLPDQVYFRFLDREDVIVKEDYEDESLDIIPVADPNMSSNTQRLKQVEALFNILGQPGVNNHEIMKRYVEALDLGEAEKIIPPPDPNAPPPPEILKMQAEIQEMGKQLELKAKQIESRDKDVLIRAHKAEADIAKTKAEAIKFIAEAEAAELGPQLELYKSQVEQLGKEIEFMREAGNPDTGTQVADRDAIEERVAPPVPEEVPNEIPGDTGLPDDLSELEGE